LEFGSPKLPQFPEAILLHYLDDMDSKMASIRGTLEAPADGLWTSRNPALRREILRTAEFLEAQPKTSAPTSAAVSSEPAFKLSPGSPSRSSSANRKAI
jgi:3'-5' exoribonuclease